MFAAAVLVLAVAIPCTLAQIALALYNFFFVTLPERRRLSRGLRLDCRR
jgi:hypothetical protein